MRVQSALEIPRRPRPLLRPLLANLDGGYAEAITMKTELLALCILFAVLAFLVLVAPSLVRGG